MKAHPLIPSLRKGKHSKEFFRTDDWSLIQIIDIGRKGLNKMTIKVLFPSGRGFRSGTVLKLIFDQPALCFIS
jgi:hypothetical protein